MNKYTDHENVAITGIQYNEIRLDKKVSYTLNNQDIDYGITLEIHDNGTSQFAHKDIEQYANPSGEQVYVVQTDTKENGEVFPEAKAPETVENITVFMRGSTSPGSGPDWETDWIVNDIPAAVDIWGPEYSLVHTVTSLPVLANQEVHAIVESNLTSTVGKDSARVLASLAGVGTQIVSTSLSAALLLNPKVAITVGVGTALTHIVAVEIDDKTGIPTPQMVQAARLLQQTFDTYPNATVELHAHSLGSMNMQYAISTLTYEQLDRVNGVHLFHGPNVYTALPAENKQKLDYIGGRIINTIDEKDFISLGYASKGSEDAAGIVRRVDSETVGFVKQHMMEGHVYDEMGRLRFEQKEAYSIIVDSVAKWRTAFRMKYEQYAKDGLSGYEKILIDGMQAHQLVEGLRLIGDQLRKDTDEINHEFMKNMEETAAQLSVVPPGVTSLTPEEVEQIYAECGYTKAGILAEARETTRHLDEEVRKIEEQIHQLADDIIYGVRKMTEHDEQLAREFERWIAGRE